jgi:AraC-like DNA-binding protein
MPGRTGIGALLSEFLTRLLSDTDLYQISDAPRLGSILIDLLAALLIHHSGDAAAEPRSHHHRTLLPRIHAFIQQNLADPHLTPTTIAAAHNISTRTLHRLFQTQDSTIAEWIRARRLDRIRRDLTDPLLEGRPIHAIAARWGFTDPTHFTRAFRAAYNLTPQTYRAHHQPAQGRKITARD